VPLVIPTYINYCFVFLIYFNIPSPKDWAVHWPCYCVHLPAQYTLIRSLISNLTSTSFNIQQNGPPWNMPYSPKTLFQSDLSLSLISISKDKQNVYSPARPKRSFFAWSLIKDITFNSLTRHDHSKQPELLIYLTKYPNTNTISGLIRIITYISFQWFASIKMYRFSRPYQLLGINCHNQQLVSTYSYT